MLNVCGSHQKINGRFMVDELYRNSFGTEEIQRHEDEFQKGFGDDEITTIKTPGSKRTGNIIQFDTHGAKHSSVPIATFSFMAATIKRQKSKKNTTSSAKSRQDDDDYEPVLSNNDEEGVDDGDDTEEKFNRCFNNAQKHSRNLRPRGKVSEVDVASKEVVEDGGIKPLVFVSLNEASKHQATSNLKQILLDDPELCDTSCDELEEYIARKDADQKLKRRKERKEYFANNKGAAPESFDEQTYSESEHSKKRRKHHSHKRHDDDDDDDDDDMYYSTEHRISDSQSKKKRFRGPDDSSSTTSAPSLSARSSGGGDEPPNRPTTATSRPGRHSSSDMHCFLCRYGNREYDAVSKEDMKKLLGEIDRGIGHTSPAALAKTIHLQYMETIFTDGRGSGTQVPVWRTRSVLEHLLYHDNDPRIVSWLNIIDCRRTIDCLAATSFVRDPNSGQIVPTKNCELKMKQEAHLWNLYKMPLDKLNFFSQTAQIDLSKNNKRIDGCFEKSGPRHFAHTRVSGLDAN